MHRFSHPLTENRLCKMFRVMTATKVESTLKQQNSPHTKADPLGGVLECSTSLFSGSGWEYQISFSDAGGIMGHKNWDNEEKTSRVLDPTGVSSHWKSTCNFEKKAQNRRPPIYICWFCVFCCHISAPFSTYISKLGSSNANLMYWLVSMFLEILTTGT